MITGRTVLAALDTGWIHNNSKKKTRNENQSFIRIILQAEFAIAIAMQNNTRPAYFHIHDGFHFAQLSNRSHNIQRNVITFHHVHLKNSVFTSADRYQTERNSRHSGQSIRRRIFNFQRDLRLQIVYAANGTFESTKAVSKNRARARERSLSN